MLSFEEQIEALSTPISYEFVHKDRNVKGEFASNDYVTWMLNHVFGPAGWSMTVLQGPDLVELSDKSAYVKVVLRLSAVFDNGVEVHKDEVGVWPLVATNAGGGGVLESTAPERYETVLKAAVSDALKACAERLGICFRPLGDRDLDAWIRGQIASEVTIKPVSVKQAMTEMFDGSAKPLPMTRADASRYWNWATGETALSADQALAALEVRNLSQFHGTFADAKAKAEAWIAAQSDAEREEDPF